MGLVAVLMLAAVGAACAPANQKASSIPPTQQPLVHAGRGLPSVAELESASCPYERGPVKEGSDADRYKVSTSVIGTSIYYLRARPKPSTYPYDHRVTTTEFHTWQITAYLTQYKVETDSDIHLVLKDAAGRSMIAEIPYGACVPTTSRWKSAIATARTTFGRHYTPTNSWHYVHRLMDVRGLGFMDTLHGQTGVAPNGVELHPVIYVYFR